jgi:hypothetical protein
METEIKNKIRILIGKYGHKAIREAVEEETKELYKYLKTVYPEKQKKKVKSHAIAEPDASYESEQDNASPVIEPIIQEEGVKNIVITSHHATGVKMTKEENKAKREKHEAVVEAKRKQLVDSGVQPLDALTKENLTEWLKTMNYWQIAEQTGCKDTEVSAKAKGFGLQSEMSKYIIAKRAAKAKK